MFCVNCGKRIDDNAKFCPYCGKELCGPQPEKKRRGVWIAVAVLALILVLLVAADVVLISRGSELSIPFIDQLFSQSRDENSTTNEMPNGGDADSNEQATSLSPAPEATPEPLAERFSSVYPNVKLEAGEIPSKIVHIDDQLFTAEHQPYVQFNQDMTCVFHVNLSMWETDITGVYEVYIYNGGRRIISCVFDFDSLTEQGGNSYASNRVFFRELSEREWEYYGELVGLTYNATRLVATEDSTIHVDQCVLDESVYLDYIGYWDHFYSGEEYPDAEVVITDISNGLVTFNIYAYRAFDFSSETAVICPDGNAYGFISKNWDNPQSFTTLTFGGSYISAELRRPEWGSNAFAGSFLLDTKSDTSAFY